MWRVVHTWPTATIRRLKGGASPAHHVELGCGCTLPQQPVILTVCVLSMPHTRRRLTSWAEGVHRRLAVRVHGGPAVVPLVRHRPLGRAHTGCKQGNDQEDRQCQEKIHLAAQTCIAVLCTYTRDTIKKKTYVDSRDRDIDHVI